jgi:hypothetical protein
MPMQGCDTTRRWAPVAAAALALWGPRAAEACAVCTAGRSEETQLAFILTTAFLTVLPLSLVGGMVWWLVRRARAMQTEPAHAADALRPPRPAIQGP